jgi:hypothetical protein
MRSCQYEKCNQFYDPKTHNQKYHSDECCRLATNERIMTKYYERKARRMGNKRSCEDCGTFLSRYNDAELCASCELKGKVSNKQVLRSLTMGRL